MKKRLLAVIVMLVVGCVFVFNPTASWAQAKGPIKIGFISPLSGGMAANGKDMLAGFELYLEQIGYQAAGRKIELIVEDDEAVPATGLTKTRKLGREGRGPCRFRRLDGFHRVCPRPLH